jgi:hypothetical protein
MEIPEFQVLHLLWTTRRIMVHDQVDPESIKAIAKVGILKLEKLR